MEAERRVEKVRHDLDKGGVWMDLPGEEGVDARNGGESGRVGRADAEAEGHGESRKLHAETADEEVTDEYRTGAEGIVEEDGRQRGEAVGGGWEVDDCGEESEEYGDGNDGSDDECCSARCVRSSGGMGVCDG